MSNNTYQREDLLQCLGRDIAKQNIEKGQKVIALLNSMVDNKKDGKPPSH